MADDTKTTRPLNPSIADAMMRSGGVAADPVVQTPQAQAPVAPQVQVQNQTPVQPVQYNQQAPQPVQQPVENNQPMQQQPIPQEQPVGQQGVVQLDYKPGEAQEQIAQQAAQEGGAEAPQTSQANDTQPSEAPTTVDPETVKALENASEEDFDSLLDSLFTDEAPKDNVAPDASNNQSQDNNKSELDKEENNNNMESTTNDSNESKVGKLISKIDETNSLYRKTKKEKEWIAHQLSKAEQEKEKFFDMAQEKTMELRQFKNVPEQMVDSVFYMKEYEKNSNDPASKMKAMAAMAHTLDQISGEASSPFSSMLRDYYQSGQVPTNPKQYLGAGVNAFIKAPPQPKGPSIREQAIAKMSQQAMG